MQLTRGWYASINQKLLVLAVVPAAFSSPPRTGRRGDDFEDELLKFIFKSILLIALLAAAIDVTSEVAATRTTSWRNLGREARGHLRNGDNQRALAGYQSALASLKSENPDAEEQYDLELLIAEVYRREHRYVEAEMIFDRLAPIIKEGKYADPMLACRFFRRRADLNFSFNRTEEALKDLSSANSVKERYFFKDSERVIAESAFLLQKLRENHHWKEWQAIIKRWHKQLEEGTAPEPVSKEYKKGLDDMHAEVIHEVAKGRLEHSQEILRTCRSIEYSYEKLLDCWLFHLYHCYALRRPLEVVNASFEIRDLLIYIEAHPQVKITTSRLVATRLGLRRIYLRKNQTALAQKESEAISKLLSLSPLNAIEKEWLELDADLRLAMIELRNDCPITESMVATLDECTSKLSQLLLKPGLSHDLDRSIRLSEVRGRLSLVIALICSGRVDEAEREIAKLNRPSDVPSKNLLPFYTRRLAGLYARLAKAELDRSCEDKARLYARIARDLLAKQKKGPTDCVHKASIDNPAEPLIRLVEERLKHLPR